MQQRTSDIQEADILIKRYNTEDDIDTSTTEDGEDDNLWTLDIPTPKEEPVLGPL